MPPNRPPMAEPVPPPPMPVFIAADTFAGARLGYTFGTRGDRTGYFTRAVAVPAAAVLAAPPVTPVPAPRAPVPAARATPVEQLIARSALTDALPVHYPLGVVERRAEGQEAWTASQFLIEGGCKAIVPPGELDLHLSQCEFFAVPCALVRTQRPRVRAHRTAEGHRGARHPVLVLQWTQEAR